MTKRSRTILFLICLFIFLLITPLIILYSQGYRFDSETKKITQTGGIFLKALPNSTEIYINGKYLKKTSQFFGSLLIQNLLPKVYEIEIKKEGFFSWKKRLKVEKKKVTEAENIILFPKNLNFKVKATKINKFWPSPDQKAIILERKEESSWYLTLFDLKKNVESILIENKDFSDSDSQLLELEWFSDSKKLLIRVALKETEKYFVLKTNQPNLLLPLSLENFDKLYFYPKNPEKLIVLKEDKLFEFDFLTHLLADISFLSDVKAFKILNGNIYYFKNSGFFFKDKFPNLGFPEKINKKPFSFKEEIKRKIFIFNDNIFLFEDPILYLFSKESESFEKFADSVKDLKMSPDVKKLSYFSNYEIWIFYLKDITNQLSKLAGDKVFLARFSEKIDQLFWLNSNYLIFNIKNKLKIVEIDERDKINIVDIAEFMEPEIFWSQVDKKLYILSNGNLFVSESFF